MKKDKKKIIIISLIAVAVIALIVIIVAVCLPKKNKTEDKKQDEAPIYTPEIAAAQLNDYEIGNFKFHDIKVLPACAKEEECFLANSYFRQISYKEDNVVINEALTTINNKTNEYYDRINAPENTKSCDKYVRNLYYKPSVETFENDQYISIAVSNNLGALCDAKSLYEDGEYYIYSKESQTMLTKEEILKAFSLTESDILSKINKYYKKDTLADLDYNIFISVNGELKITFLGDDGRYYITLQELYKESQDDQTNQSSGLTDIDFE